MRWNPKSKLGRAATAGLKGTTSLHSSRDVGNTVGARMSDTNGAPGSLHRAVRRGLHPIRTAIVLVGVSFVSFNAMAVGTSSGAGNFYKTNEASAQRGSAPAQQITRAGSEPSSVGPEANFTGRVRVDMVWPADGSINASGALVTFEPGARSAWHTHPAGQRLAVVSGVGLTQEWGKPVHEIRPGDVVWCPPGVKHWHGAARKTAMTHLAVTGTADGKNVDWMEKVSDEQYNAR
jgi:quercetin dioxygenase-like cupin family protein